VSGTDPAEAGEPTIRDVLWAARRLRWRVRRTPLESAAAVSAAAGVEVLLKLEHQQRTGSFKLRGALNAVAALPGACRAAGLVTASAGNHGLGVAFAARSFDVEATVFVPAGAAESKCRRIGALGASLRQVAGDYDDAHAEAEQYAEARGATYVHAFSDPAVVAGQGTVALEILRQRPDLRTLVVPVGGGGLIGGCGLVARALAPDLEVVGVQSAETSAMHASLASGAVSAGRQGATLCDGLAGDIDERSLALARRVVDRVVLVEESAVGPAMRRLFEEEGIVAEGSAAVVAAALFGGAIDRLRGPVAAVISGGNVDAAVLGGILLKVDAA
jgi:threonine dehydratase